MLLLSLVAAACVAAGKSQIGGLSTQQPARTETFRREVAPFRVVDEHGIPYEFPFLGGFDAPRPQFADIDGDGDFDLFVQEYSHSVRFFENVGTPSVAKFEWRTDRYQDLDVGEWYRLVDLDADGDLDLLAEEPFSHVRFWRNNGSRTEPRFEYTDSLRDSDGKAMYVDRQNVPAIVDLDCDGRLDLFIGRVEGIVARYEADVPGTPSFTLVTDFFEGIEIVGQIDTTGTRRHGANALAFADFDSDGDQDLFWGDFFERGVLLIENIGRTCSTPSLRSDPYVLPYADSVLTSGYNAPAPVDIDHDGDLDFLMGVLGGAFNALSTASDNFYFWERTAADRFELRTRRFLNGIDLGSESAPALVDLDGDGDLDLVVGNKIDPVQADGARLFVYMNDGSATSPSFRFADSLYLGESYNNAPAFGDLDGDGDFDLLLGTWNQDILYFRNVGGPQQPRFVIDSTMTIHLPRVSNATPVLGDIDGDGDLDLFVGEANGEINFLRNEGSSTTPRFVVVSDRLADIDAGRRSAPALLDVDGDGLLDLVIGREEPGVAVFRNAGTGTLPRFEPYERFTLALPPGGTPAFADVDRDGTTDAISGSISGGLVFFRGVRGGLAAPRASAASRSGDRSLPRWPFGYPRSVPNR
jgi:hypothetical protein